MSAEGTLALVIFLLLVSTALVYVVFSLLRPYYALGKTATTMGQAAWLHVRAFPAQWCVYPKEWPYNFYTPHVIGTMRTQECKKGQSHFVVNGSDINGVEVPVWETRRIVKFVEANTKREGKRNDLEKGKAALDAVIKEVRCVHLNQDPS